MAKASTLKQLIQEITKQKAPGPSITYTPFHMFYTLELIAKEPLGRNRLAEKLSVGDGAVRTIINRLKEANLISVSRGGCTLTKRGQEVWRKFEEFFPKRAEIPKNELAVSKFNYAFLVKNCGNKVKSGIDQRDAAIIAGAKRAIVIVSNNGHLCIENVSESIEKDYPKAASQILKQITPQSNDVVIIAGADAPLKAKLGAFAASWSLIEQ
jgi:predicted transcriptional regulator